MTHLGSAVLMSHFLRRLFQKIRMFKVFFKDIYEDVVSRNFAKNVKISVQAKKVEFRWKFEVNRLTVTTPYKAPLNFTKMRLNKTILANFFPNFAHFWPIFIKFCSKKGNFCFVRCCLICSKDCISKICAKKLRKISKSKRLEISMLYPFSHFVLTYFLFRSKLRWR